MNEIYYEKFYPFRKLTKHINFEYLSYRSTSMFVAEDACNLQKSQAKVSNLNIGVFLINLAWLSK